LIVRFLGRAPLRAEPAEKARWELVCMSEESGKDNAFNSITSLPDADGVSVTKNNVSEC